MSENIAGYIDRSYIKGQYYRYAASPKPTVSAANFDTDMEDLVAKAVFVTRNQTAGGTFPNSSSTNFLFTTYAYGNNTYLQVAYATDTGCEYRRFYIDGGWKNWYQFDSNINSIDGRCTSLESDVSTIKTSETEEWAVPYVRKIAKDAKETADAANITASSMSGRIGTVEGQVSGVVERMTPLGPKLVVVKNTLPAVGMTIGSGEQLYHSVALHVPLTQYGFTEITGIFVGLSAEPKRNCIPVLSTFNTTELIYYLMCYRSGDLAAGRVDTFLIIGK